MIINYIFSRWEAVRATGRSVVRLFFRNKIFFFNLLAGGLLNIALWLLLYFLTSRIEDKSQLIPLHYNIYFGIDLIGSWYKLYIMPAGGLFVLIINAALAYFFYGREKLLSYFLIFSSTLAQVFLLIVGVMVVVLNL